MAQQVPVEQAALADESMVDGIRAVLPDLGYKRLAIVNCVFVGSKGGSTFTLVDAGIPGFAASIRRSASEYYTGPRPAAIILTHAHFDHVGSLESLLETWDVPVYAHQNEFPYLNGQASYPPPDPEVGGGLMAATSSWMPRGPIDIRNHLQLLPEDGIVPTLPGWRWIHTPGHSPGHVSLWRESDRTLVVGDAFITTAQESVYAALTQEPELHGPPMYYTVNWEEAAASVRVLAGLKPETIITGHGRAMSGPAMRAALNTLADRFEEIAVPEAGRYVLNPLDAESGSAYVSK